MGEREGGRVGGKEGTEGGKTKRDHRWFLWLNLDYDR